MNDNQRFSILTFPQHFNGEELTVNIVVLPRDQNPLSPAIEQHPTIADAVAFADAQLSFTASIFDSLNVFPHNHAPISEIPLTVAPLTNHRTIFEALAGHFDLSNLNSSNSNDDLIALAAQFKKLKPEDPRAEQNTVKTYLPPSYRNAFNFTTPRHKNAVTDDSYHCAIKAGKQNPNFQRSTDQVSWGKVFAYLMRQPLLARQAGLVYETQLSIEPSHFPNGGWLTIDLAQDSDYRDQLNTDDSFIKRYAARIPELIADTPRQVFAPLQFPVLFKAQESDPDPAPIGNYDELFIEAAEYVDGFAKIVHCQQPPNRDLLVEENDGAHPVKDIGIHLGWDDEQILIWYIRQMLADPTGQLSGRLDAPLGVFGYHIDVRETAEPENPWESLNAVESRQPLILSSPQSPGNPVQLGAFNGELPYQVYPVQVDGDRDKNYWLPMYYANWIGQSMVLPDADAANIYQTTNVDVLADPIDANNDIGTGVSHAAVNQLNQIYQAGSVNTELRYSNNYQFRVRMQDLSGGAPGIETNPLNPTSSDITQCRFKRYISPNQPRIIEMLALGNGDNGFVNTDSAIEITQLNIQRPKLGYPAVIFTDKYSNPVQRLITQANLGIMPVDNIDPNLNGEHRVGLGIADPDVDRIEITVEIATLKLDKLASVSGKEDYIHLYTTYRAFPNIANDGDYEAILNIPIQYRDVRVLHSGDEIDLVNDLNLTNDIDDLPEIVLPTGRTVRLTIRAVCEEKADNENYYGFINPGNKLLDNRFGEPFQIMAYSPSIDETALLIHTPSVPVIQGIFMQPDVVTVQDGKFTTLLLGKQETLQGNNVQLLSDQLNIDSSQLTLSARKGERVIFGCSSRIRHTLAPDHSSLTFAAKGDLINHWLCCISFTIDRDWMWDALQNRSMIIRRTKRYANEEIAESSNVVVGDLEISRTVSFESLHNPQRNASRIVFIDALEPKKEALENTSEPGFPDAIEVSYSIEVNFKTGHAEQNDTIETLALSLPITTTPAQVPKIVSAGIALSPYVRNENYSASEVRKRQLWIEFSEPVKDPNDTYFARVLAVAPDQLISNNKAELFVAPEESILPLNPENIRVITEGATNDLAGLNAMQAMTKSSSSDRHYLLPLPPGLHANSDEMFGFFTYEFRLGHFRNPASEEMVWTTAQGRFGRRLRATGIQHSAPTLTCMPNRDNKKLWLTAPYAVAVHAGKNVTADPPRTQLWALLYAQVKQADNKDYRNILLDDRQLDWQVQIEPEQQVNVIEKYSEKQLQTLKAITIKNFKYEVNAVELSNIFKLIDFSTKNKDATKYGTVVWSNNEINQLLACLGLPQGSSLSVLVVEILPQINNIAEHISGLGKPATAETARSFVTKTNMNEFNRMVKNEKDNEIFIRANIKTPSPVSDELGDHRILRTSPLTEVPEICN